MFNNVAMWPAGSMFSNAKDLSRWVIALLNEGRLEGKQVMSASLVNQMVQTSCAGARRKQIRFTAMA